MKKYYFSLFFCSIFLVFYIFLDFYCYVLFEKNCGGYLKRAADSNTVEIAKKELGLAVKYLEENKITDGSTHVFWNTPSTDVGFWYRNIKASQEELNKVGSEVSQLEKTNLLMKLRETLLDHSEKGDIVTVPYQIHLFPRNSLFFILGVFNFFVCAFCCFLILIVSVIDK